MRKIFKRLISLFLIPLTRLYLRKEREFNYQDITITVFPGVFHPGLFYSTKFLLSYLSCQSLKETSFLELGCGTGTISVMAAKAGASVIASDLSKTAVKNVEANSHNNRVSIQAIHSDLFENIPSIKFDWIIINPPYYAGNPSTEEELAWKCGENFEYFKKLFLCLADYSHQASNIIMVLTKGCDLSSIFSIAKQNGFEFELLEERNVLFDGKDYIYKISLI
jgi:release factor glutamine methyltransferase